MSDICPHGVERAEVVDVHRVGGYMVSAIVHVPVDALRIALFDVCGEDAEFTGAVDENGDEMALPDDVVSDLRAQALDAWEEFRNANDGWREREFECDCGGCDGRRPCRQWGLGGEL